MTRDEIREEVLQIKNNNVLCEIPTGTGKSRAAIEFAVQRGIQPSKLLIVIPRKVLIDNWKDEFDKWGHPEFKDATFVTYISFPKKAGIWDMVIFDECHHLSPRCQEALDTFIINNSILLSATVKKQMRFDLKLLFKDLGHYKLNVKQATEEGILPDPKVYLYPLFLKNTPATYSIVYNPKMSNPVVMQYKDRWAARRIKNRKVIIKCSQREYYADMSGLIEFYKKKSFGNQAMKNKFLHESSKRLKWLSDEKVSVVQDILRKLSKERTLTFCNGISQTELLGTYCINSKNKDSKINLQMFNDGKIDHITACNMLDEGVNLTSCRVGVYAVLNSSERMIVQKLGRILRHPKPIIIIPYYKYTRDEEIVQKMRENYNPNLIKTITNLNEIQL